MSNWKIIVPEGRANMVLNPSAETTGNYAAIGGGAVTREVLAGKFGRYYYYLTLVADDEGMSLTLASLGNADHYVTMYRERVAGAADWDWSLNGVAYWEPAAICDFNTTSTFSGYTLYGRLFTSSEANGSTTLYIRQKGAGNLTLRLDGIQVEPEGVGEYFWTTFIDGDQDGCQWDGTPHASSSRRTSVSRAGGRMLDFDEYGFNIEAMIGAGTVPHQLSVDNYALLPGGELSNDKLSPRTFALVGSIQEDDWTDFHITRANLAAILTPEAYPRDARGPQEIKIWYTGATTVKEISASYQRGLDLALSARNDPCYFERNIALTFLAADPLWYEVGNTSRDLDENDSVALRYIAGRIYSIGKYGQWDNLSVDSTGGPVYAIAVGPDNKVYVGGDFDTMDGVANTLNIAVYDPFADTWAALGSGLENATSDGMVYALAFGPDGTLYAGGDFVNAGADADADYLAQWTGAAWSAVGGAGTRNGAVRAIIFDADGNLIIGGDFTDWVAGVRLDYVAQWDGTTWDYLFLDELDNDVYALALAPNGDVYIGGKFTKMNAVNNSRNYICRWDGTTSHQLGTSNSATGNGTSGYVYAIAIDRAGAVYLGGDFSTAMGDTMNNIAKWNGTMFEALGNGVGDIVRALTFGPDDTLWVGGEFTSMTDLDWVDALARWKDNSWAAADINFPASTIVYAIAVGGPDPVLSANYDVWIGFDQNGTAYIAGDTAILYSTQSGGWLSYPKFYIERSGGTSVQLVSMKNTANGYELMFDYGLEDGERLTVDLTATQKRVVSDFYGAVPSALLPNSDFGSFALLSRTTATGYMLLFADLAGAATVDAWLEYRRAYESID